MIKKIVIGGLLSVSVSSGVYAAENIFAGPYAGGSLSRVEASMTQEDSDCWYNCSAYTQVDDSFSLGIQGGYNWVNENVLLGVEFNYTDGGPSETFQAGFYTGPAQDMQYASELKSLMSLRFRAGLVLNKTAVILAAGPAKGDFDHEFRDQNNTAGVPADDDAARYSDETSGWVTSIGIEHAFTDNIIGGASYSRYSFDDEQSTVIEDNFTGLDTGSIVKFVDSADTFNLTVNYKF